MGEGTLSESTMQEEPTSARAGGTAWEAGGGDAPTGYAATGLRWPEDLESNPVFRLLVFHLRRRSWRGIGFFVALGLVQAAGTWIVLFLQHPILLPYLLILVAVSFAASFRRIPVIRLVPDQAWMDLIHAGLQPRDITTGITAFIFSRPMSLAYSLIGWAEASLLIGLLLWSAQVPVTSRLDTFFMSLFIPFLPAVAAYPTLAGFAFGSPKVAKWWAGLIPFQRETKRMEAPFVIRSSAELEEETRPPWIPDPTPEHPPEDGSPKRLFGKAKPKSSAWRAYLRQRSTFEGLMFVIVMNIVWGGPYHVPAVLAIVGVCVLEWIRTQRGKGPLASRVNEWGAPVQFRAELEEHVRRAWDRIPKTEGYKRAVQSRGDR